MAQVVATRTIHSWFACPPPPPTPTSSSLQFDYNNKLKPPCTTFPSKLLSPNGSQALRLRMPITAKTSSSAEPQLITLSPQVRTKGS